MLLALKLVLVPAFLAALTVAGRVWGPNGRRQTEAVWPILAR